MVVGDPEPLHLDTTSLESQYSKSKFCHRLTETMTYLWKNIGHGRSQDEGR
ncbi:hypothetical protein GBA52_008251, partial [Prunus armeniaca]